MYGKLGCSPIALQECLLVTNLAIFNAKITEWGDLTFLSKVLVLFLHGGPEGGLSKL